MSLPPNPYSNSIPSKPTFALPARPKFEAPASWDIRKQNPRQPRAPSPNRRRDTDTYRPRAPTPPRREVDRYVPEDSSERNQRTARDSYIPSGESGTRRQQIDSYRPEESNRSSRSTDRRNFSTSTSRSPEKRDRDRSPSRTRDSSRYTHREDHRDSYRDATESTKSLKDRINQLEPDTKLSPIKRIASPLSEDRPHKVTKTAPITPPLLPVKPSFLPPTTGPREQSNIPTGPRADRHQINAYSNNANPHHHTQAEAFGNGREAEMNRRGKGKSAGANKGGGAGTRAAGAVLPPPIFDRAHIVALHGQGVPLKPAYLDNPKSPLANHMGSVAPIKYNAQTGTVNGKKIVRVTVVADEQRGIIGTGDASSAKDAEKLAALSAVLQLQSRGLLGTGGPQKAAVTEWAAAGQVAGGSSETVKLSDGSMISYDRARQFMDYYVQRYNFPKPDLDFSQSTSRKGSKKGASKWEVALKVDGRVIGMGEGSTKKQAQVKTYLDVTQYLEGCDRALWDDFTNASAKAPMEDIGMAPHLVFQMSDPVSDDVQAITDDIRRSNLYKNAPASGVAAESQTLPTWMSNGKRKATAAELDAKSQRLRDQLDDYYTDPKMDKMRQQRDALPIKTRASDILAKIEMNDVTIIMAATGSGKTTQVPQLLFDDFINRGQGAHCNILCTQPRRLAAMSVADRIADERGQKLGQQVGYQVRFDVKAPEPDGCITFCTTGIFLKRMQSALGATADPESVEQMDKVTHIVVDEVHERDIDTDLSLVVLKRLLADRKKKNKPLKVILMSATIDPTLFKTYFPDERGRPAPVADVPGRTFPVTKFFLDDILQDLRGLRPAEGGWIFQDKLVADYLAHEMQPNPAAFSPTTGMNLAIPYPLVALTIAYVLNRSNDGHVLVFLPGWEEIKKVSNILLDTSSRTSLLGTRFNDSNQYSVHYLHSSIPAAEQKEVFKPPPKGVRRIILATNIAETSITIPDVVYVVDAARVKEKRYDPERHMSSLVAAWVGSSNLNQRAGRAGRHREGEYFGLLSKRRYEALETHQTVEMMRSDLSNVVMHVKALNLGVVEEVMAAVIEPPEPSRIVAAMDSLRMLGALDGEKNLTSLGRVLLQLPVDAAIGKLCLYGSFFRCLDSALTLAAILTNRDPFLAPLEKKREADEIKDSWSPVAFRSDPLAIWAAYNEWAVFEDTGVYYKGNQFCSANFLSKATLMQIKQVKGSLLQSLDQAGVIAVSAGGNVNRIGRRTVVPKELNQNGGSLPLLAALLAMASAPNFALRTSEKTCRTAQDKNTFIHASSVNSRRRETGGPEIPSTSFDPAEKRLYAFTEKTRNVPLGSKPGAAGTTNLRNVTRLDPMTYMLFGAYHLLVTRRGLECDGWLPVTGNLYALDDVQRLKTLFEKCMLRVFEGVGKSLTRGRDERRRDTQSHVRVQHGSSRIQDDGDGDEDMEDGEKESDDEDDQRAEKSRNSGPLTGDEVKELELLTTDVVKVLEAYASEREGGSVAVSRPASRPQSPGLQGVRGMTNGHGGAGGNGLGGGGGGAYRPPARR